MATITTRSGKGSPLTNTEVDNNFENLNADKLETAGGSMTGNLSLADNVKAIFGAGSDLQIYHDGTHSRISEVGTGNLKIQATDFEIINAANNEYVARFITDGAVTLYYDNAAKLATTSTGVDVTGNATFADNGKAIFGAGSDLQIYHDGSNSVIADAGTGILEARTNGTEIQLTGNSGTDYMARFISNGAVNLYYDNAIKLATTSTGVAVTGDATFGDNGKAIFGAGSDLQIYHDGSNSFIKDLGTGSLFLEGQNHVYIRGAGTGSTLARFTEGAQSELYHNNVKTLNTTSTGVDVTGTVMASDSVQIDSGGTGFFVGGGATGTTAIGKLYNSAGFLTLATDGTRSMNLSTGTTQRMRIDGSTGDISFYEDTGTTAQVVWDASADALTFGDNVKATFGAGSDLQIYHDGSNSYITDAGTGDLLIRSSNDLWLQNAAGTETYARFDEGASTYISYAGSTKLTTTSTGVDVSGSITADGLTVDGNITSTGGDLNLATLDLNAIAASKAVTAVDVFVYDTSKDSDGGAWRNRTQHTSWYNETLNTATRGSRREFPAVAVIVAESSKVTIYDGDDPALPMWMVFNGGGNGALSFDQVSGSEPPISSLNFFNGVMCVGQNGAGNAQGVRSISFLAETIDRMSDSARGATYRYLGNISKRNSGLGGYAYSSAAIVNLAVNDVAMTVLSNAPIDPATGLPMPTIAVATAGGVSVIKDDGNVWDITGTNWGASSNGVIFDGGTLYFIQAAYYWIACDVAGLSQDYVLFDGYNTNNDNYPFTRVNLSETLAYEGGLRRVAAGGSWFDLAHCASYVHPGRRLVQHKRSVPGGPNLVNYVTPSFSTGWLPGAIKGAFLSSTDATSLVGSGELVTNGTFDTDTSGWTFSGTATDSSSAGYLEGSTATNNTLAYTSITTVAGSVYTVQMDVVSATANAAITAGTTAFGSTLGISNYVASGNTATFTFVATGSLTYISVRSNSVPHTVRIDNVSVKLADADRSVNNKGLIVNGTVTRSAVATGAELVAYSGFSASNYLEQPYNSALDFGTGDFCVMGWFKTSSVGTDYIVHLATPGVSSDDNSFFVYIDGSGYLSFATRTGSASFVTAATAVTDNVWRHFCAVRSFSGTIHEIYINGVLHTSASATARNISTSTQHLFVGSRADNAGVFAGSLALLRISATAPTAEQIKKIYEDEKVLFQDNAACTLYGTSDAVTALAHDSDTGLLHVGTSAGRSVFQGLRRVSNTTTAVGTAISAANGMIAEE